MRTFPCHLLLGALLAAAPEASATAVPGEPAPAFRLPDAAGAMVELAELAGRPVALNFWASWCAPCLEELPRLDDLQDELGDTARIVAINIDERPARARAVLRHLGVDLAVLYDVDRSVADRYAPPAMPTTYVLDPSGRVVEVHAGGLDAAAVAELGQRLRELAGGDRAP